MLGYPHARPREGELSHARALLKERGGHAGEEPSNEIVESWSRCIAAGLDMTATTKMPVVPMQELSRRREQAQFVRGLALTELETLFHQIAGSNFLLAFADPEGTILDLYADNRFSMSQSGESICAGSLWTEADAGTNGLGTALAAGHSVAVNGPEHFFAHLTDISCTSAPIRDADGCIVGALDAASYFESRQRHTQALVQMAATHIENVLIESQRAGDVVVAIHPRPEFLGTISAGLLAFDGDGRLSAYNARATSLLAGLDVSRTARFDDLFNEPYERFLARLHAGDDTRLRDALGSVLVSSWVNRRVGSQASVSRGAAGSRPSDTATYRSTRGTSAAPAREVAGEAAEAAPNALPNVAKQTFLAEDPAVRHAVATVEAAVRRSLPILIQGETGSGKELLARHAHLASGRSGAFVPVNCASLPADLFEAEFFGYVGGAFTGARREGGEGLVGSAEGGTLLLDEVQELPLPLQAALLRFLDDGVIRPVGGQKTRRVELQLLAATNADLGEQVAARRFRADLLYRLETIRVELPPLRDRSDFSAAVHHVLGAIDARARVTSAAVALLATHDWPGNFRELRSTLTRALLMHPTQWLDAADLRPLMPRREPEPNRSALGTSALQHGATQTVLREYERTGSVSQTSRNLGISRTTVYRHLREAGVAVQRDVQAS